ncbi:hypothetical protein D5F51_04085 [Yersinia hibernica]|uniref:Glycine-rich domain-containing protein n=1 Tax=Yersinia hibernica TaxID=2339259 RepID=A0ABX5QWN2_9GAMM|nr:phage tail protein [Yersinia hibernica]QAX77794.1 hypothetical protein D5F51_04085 [Yersinia hibernica]
MKNIMPPIDTPDNIFHDGNPATGEQGTIVPGLWLTNVQGAIRNTQQELISVLAEAGIEINESENNQLLLAILSLISNRSPELPVASLILKGITQLSSSTTSNSEALAATPKAVKAVNDTALKIANNLSEIAVAGPASVAQTLANLGLSDVAHIPFVQTMGARMISYLTAGTFVFTVPNGVTRIRVRVVGGGGGAGGSAAAKSGGGGGAGGYAEDCITVSPGQVLSITVGANGVGGTAGNSGSTGGASSVSGYLSASGGAFGDAGGGGTGAGGFGGAGTGGSINTVGSDGSDGATTATVGSGIGGGSVLGGSTRSGGTGRNSLSIGGGGAASYTLASQNGGNGHAGAVILEY